MTMLDDRDRLLLDTLRALAKANEEIGRLRAALKDIQVKAVGNPPRHTWYYDRAEDALAPQSDGAGQPPKAAR